MSSELQLISIIINIIFGFFLYFITKINNILIKDEVILLKILITILICFDTTLIYLTLFYNLTSGIFSIYYLLSIVGGISIANIVNRNVKIMLMAKKIIDRIKRK